MKILSCFVGVFLMLIPPVGEGAVVLKTKGKKALIHLEGYKTKKGAWFEVMDLYGRSKGIVQITKVGRRKAIGVVRLGRIKKHWALEPQSARWAGKIQRKVQLKKRRSYLRQLAWAKKKRKQRLLRKRRLASENLQNEEYLINSAAADDYAGDGDYYPQESADSDWESPRPAKKKPEADESDRVSYDYQEQKPQGIDLSKMDLALGLMGAAGLNSITLKPIPTGLSGLGWEGMGFLDMNFQNGFGVTGFGGYKKLQMSNQNSSECGSDDPCALIIQYIKVGMDLKYLLFSYPGVDVWGGISGSLLWTMKESVFNNAGLTEDSFGIHGTLGPVLGATLKTGRLIFPLSLRVSIFNPPTETTFSWAVFFRAGMGLSI